MNHSSSGDGERRKKRGARCPTPFPSAEGGKKKGRKQTATTHFGGAPDERKGKKEISNMASFKRRRSRSNSRKRGILEPGLKENLRQIKGALERLERGKGKKGETFTGDGSKKKNPSAET